MSNNAVPIAIIGSGCRFPGHVDSPSKLWELIHSPSQLAKPIPLERFSAEGFYHQNAQYHGHMNVKKAYFLAEEGVHRRFDASFFGMNGAEANALDPQCRLLLETVYEALESAGLTIDALRGSDTAIYTGQMVADYDLIMTRDTDDSEGNYHATGTSRAMISNRISYFFDWHGPSMTIDTACSSSLVALHHAIQQLRLGQSRVAIATGANLLLDPRCFISLSSLNMLSPDGHSRMWDADANGYARGEGIAAIVLKTLSAAIEDGDDIECIVRETGFAQDGKTQGITMPNHAAQSQLIRDCYARIGLDQTNPAHRPQFFECHGTGTHAGDAAEAEAISSAFFPDGIEIQADSNELLVGSIKSVLGHTEGTAGLAGILKSALALQNAIIPPNLLFNRLNPRIKPFYANLKVSTVAMPWPAVLPGNPRRASVNSFGFGGANVHAILESYIPPIDSAPTNRTVIGYAPFVLSASSEASLVAYLEKLCHYLRRDDLSNICLRDLAYTLYRRRTCFQVTTAVSALTLNDLCTKLDAKIQAGQDDTDQPSMVRALRHRPSSPEEFRVLGIFTGQGAQWAGMGSELITGSVVARRIVERLEERLSQLPVDDRPSWSLIEELQKGLPSSRIDEATLSQPLCTAVQILQIDLLRAARIEFAAVVGHSSGEIAAAYAANFISAGDAICIAYYRGLHSKLASWNEKSGAMIAVGTTFEDAQELCEAPEFKGRVRIAAINSSASLTMSGDRDAIEELNVLFNDEKKFARILKVDKAYHSHHMSACSAPYCKSLISSGIQTNDGKRCPWFSSVFGGEEMLLDKREILKGAYWDINMCQTVLFQQAINSAHMSKGPFDLALEIGPHPALKGPTLQNIQESSGQAILHTSLFKRGVSAVESVADGLGFMWSHLGKNAVDLQNYEKFLSQDCPCKLVKGLPTYAWDHKNDYWNESRYAKAVRVRPGPVHELLGHLNPDSTDQEMRWRHVLRPTEIPWLLGHRLQDQIVFPAAGYVVTALEAAMAICKHKGISASLIEIVDMDFGKALVFNQDESGVEIIVSMAEILNLDSNIVEAQFKYYAADSKGDGLLSLMSHGVVHISIGEPCTDALPIKLLKPPNLINVRADDFYTESKSLDYQWDGPFVALDKIERKLGAAIGVLNNLEPSTLLVHPAILDAAFQSVLLAYSFPGDGQLWTIHVPDKIQRVSVNPFLCAREMAKGEPLPFHASHNPDTKAMFGDTDVYSNDVDLDNAIMQVQKLECVPLSRATAQDDKEPFATVLWDVASPDAQLITRDEIFTSEQQELARHLERMACFYLRTLETEIPSHHHSRIQGPYTHFFNFASQAFSYSQTQKVPYWCREWEYDTYELLNLLCEPFTQSIDMQLLRGVGESIIGIVRDKRPETEAEIRYKNMASLYTNAYGPGLYNTYLARILKQIVHRHPHMDILEIGTGAGATTKAVLTEIGSTFCSYTRTNISPSCLDSEKPWAEPHLRKMVFGTLDIGQDPVTQGFREHSYDLIIAPLVLHATPVLAETLRNVRRLLKPGGYLIPLELLPTKSAVYGLTFGLSPSSWLSVDHGSAISPALGLVEWDALLRKTGFSGCDSTTAELSEQNCFTHFTVFTSQAMDDKINFLRHPLSSATFDPLSPGKLINNLVILGGNSLETSKLVEQTQNLVHRYCASIRTARTLLDLPGIGISPDTAILSLVDLDSPVFQNLDTAQWDALKDMLMTVKTLLWVTRGRRVENPYANMMVGLMRSVVREVPTLSYQILDIEETRNIDTFTLAEALLRFQAENLWRQQDSTRVSAESELVLNKHARFMIPRLVVNKSMNDRYNSSKRSLMAQFNFHAQNIRVASSDNTSGYELRQEPEPVDLNNAEIRRIEVTHSLLAALRVAEFGYMFVILGKNRISSDQVIALSTNHSSIVWDSENISVQLDVQPGSEAVLLSLVIHHLITLFTLRSLSKGDSVLVYEPGPEFMVILAKEAQKIGVQVNFATTRPPGVAPEDSKWFHIHHSAPTRLVSRLLHPGISTFVDLAGPTDIGNQIRAQLPPHCRRVDLGVLFTPKAWAPPRSRINGIHENLQKAVTRACYTLTETWGMKYNTLPVIPAASLAEADSHHPPNLVIDWTGNPHIPALIRPIDTQITFTAHKTYWLAGLSGGLGLSLCEWMVRHGAKYFVISSRRPSIDPRWVEEMRDQGAVIKISAWLVVFKRSYQFIYVEAC
ncbi:Polyketide synthase-nonribosomal peptide synthetase [Lachnellula subtilissima]|uniref:Polyketide synthase-nonribosomal peptide synthetase n=1 Tax=Lachnellula subtilissima TaxID=602034 RepID=A0A8H8RJU0_9HELO|nr:Polyketide synthase-nonribosomal peptide synthetase [Lachnellula subtilissima]